MKNMRCECNSCEFKAKRGYSGKLVFSIFNYKATRSSLRFIKGEETITNQIKSNQVKIQHTQCEIRTKIIQKSKTIYTVISSMFVDFARLSFKLNIH